MRLSPDGKTLFFTEARPEDYPERIGRFGVVSRLYEIDVATGTVTLIRGPLKTGLEKLHKDDDNPMIFSAAASALGIRLLDWLDGETIVFSHRNLYSYNARTGVTIQLDKKLKLSFGATLPEVVLTSVRWGGKYALVGYTTYTEIAAVAGGWNEEMFRVKDGQFYGEPIAGGGASYQYLHLVMGFADGDTAIVFQEEGDSLDMNQPTYKIGFWGMTKPCPGSALTFNRRVPINIRDGEIITLDNTFSAEAEPGVYRITRSGKAEKLHAPSGLPFDTSSDYQWNWEYDDATRLLYGAARLATEEVAYVYDCAAQELSMVCHTAWAPWAYRFVKGVIPSPATAKTPTRAAAPRVVKTFAGRDTQVFSLFLKDTIFFNIRIEEWRSGCTISTDGGSS